MSELIIFMIGVMLGLIGSIIYILPILTHFMAQRLIQHEQYNELLREQIDEDRDWREAFKGKEENL